MILKAFWGQIEELTGKLMHPPQKVAFICPQAQKKYREMTIRRLLFSGNLHIKFVANA